jgi:hypothetical protein
MILPILGGMILPISTGNLAMILSNTCEDDFPDFYREDDTPDFYEEIQDDTLELSNAYYMYALLGLVSGSCLDFHESSH